MGLSWFAESSDISKQHSCAHELEVDVGSRGSCSLFCNCQRGLHETGEF